MGDNRFSRRYFFYGSLLAGAVPVGGFGSTPSLKALGYKSFNEKLNIAAVGVGTRGPEILRGAAPTENIVALCDVDEEKRRARLPGLPEGHQTQRFPQDARYRGKEHRRGDDRHARPPAYPGGPALHAARKACLLREAAHPHGVGSAASWRETAAKYKVATQMGNQGFNHEGTKTACEILWSGDIGEVARGSRLDRVHIRRPAQSPRDGSGSSSRSRRLSIGTSGRVQRRRGVSIR